jgi:hypothetical protein
MGKVLTTDYGRYASGSPWDILLSKNAEENRTACSMQIYRRTRFAPAGEVFVGKN